MKRPFESIRETVFDHIKQSKENAKIIFNYIDKLLVWVVGFSIGGVSLIASDFGKLRETFCPDVIKWILLCLGISIISGIIFRIGAVFFQVYSNQINTYIETAFSSKEFMAIEPDDLSEEMDIKEVLRRLKDDFDEDASHILNEYVIASEAGKLFLLNDLKKHYKNVGEWAKRDYENAIEFTKDTMQKAYGFSRNQIEHIFKENTSLKWRISLWVSYLAFLISCLSFILVIIMLCSRYLDVN